ncbi:RNA polymerase sigma factor [Methylobacterium nodulans]|uniref:RNA polymerase, sigma-24 subunit, ECF subfamily n=1 Tax=Methylobacterium nodulans (strain LMG 21967 / CNCM I-2342 / ORS 2060) TaxID=460265 RepID=B8IFH0_METNO|nr:RNA polymerase sigma factor [Methylobacterium nodulans]ACL57705.1 RNA polymerase, sigma-24 subunit, ECF subfamily [Methylobacterium nodulans ORS 2060]
MDELTALIAPHIPALRRYAWALLRDCDAADDLVQDTLEHAVRRWHLRRQDGDVRGWLFTIEHNLFVSFRRRWARRGVHVSLDEALAVPGAPGAEEQIGMGDLLAGLDVLPTEQRSAILLVGVEGLSYTQAARALAIPVGTLMSRLSRGRERLQAYLDTGQLPRLRRVK